MQPSWYQNKCTVQQCYKHTKLLHIGMMALIGRHYYFDDVRDTKYFHTHKNTWMIHQTKHVYPFFYSGIRASPKNFRDTISTQSVKCPASAIHQHQPPRVLPSLCSYLSVNDETGERYWIHVSLTVSTRTERCFQYVPDTCRQQMMEKVRWMQDHDTHKQNIHPPRY